MKVLKLLFSSLLFCLLTLFTQIGGLVYLSTFFLDERIENWTSNLYARLVLKFTAFLLLYCFATFLLIPFIAEPFGRIPLPIIQTGNVQPLNFMTCLLNRHYVRPELKQYTFDVAKQLNKQYPGSLVNYLDGNFPFINNFPLFPHLSHNDGKKLDLAFCYTVRKTNLPTNDCPSFIGYGISEEPLQGELDMPNICEERGYWQYSFLKRLLPQENGKHFKMDEGRTKKLITLFAVNQSIEKIFLEPHLKARLNLTTAKIRFHGCQAVRHDDHIHIQLR